MGLISASGSNRMKYRIFFSKCRPWQKLGSQKNDELSEVLTSVGKFTYAPNCLSAIFLTLSRRCVNRLSLAHSFLVTLEPFTVPMGVLWQMAVVVF